ncbi:tripartite tricarboxylate transporter substrate binding protein [Variovorax sp. OV329]|uniref:Bug family tripartite tricarboxylate transporter substrate binding protein n=1 Tax=Variovorax sp. OV329 TaxID=1882825 RepID=UPI0008EDE25E|nr:tripartite tricarboxylate transporter substrate binding protein [Variovorax sp. OV329]SFM21401.1 Tripartite-type tricarboxylate transporter, receptor component TctC [Variovorax sp. OV329]
MQRRTALIGLAGIAAGATTTTTTWAQGLVWPGATVRIVVPYGAGGGTTDPLARVFAEELGKELGTSFIVENKPGANGNIGAVLVKRAPADGSVFLFTGTGTLATNMALYKDPGFDTLKDFDPVVLVGNVPNVLVVNPSLKVNSVKEFVAYAQKNPGALTYASTGNGSSMHTAGELFSQSTHVKMLHVPYNGAGPATTDLLAGTVQAMFQLVPGIVQQVKAGKVRALAVMAARRSASLPDVPTMAEAGYPGLESSTGLGFVAPRGTSPAIAARMNAAVNTLLQRPAFRARVAEMGVEPMGGSQKEFAAFLGVEIKKWGDVVRNAGMAIE